MVIRSSALKFAWLIFIVMLGALLWRVQRPLESSLQYEFDGWLSKTQGEIESKERILNDLETTEEEKKGPLPSLEEVPTLQLDLVAASDASTRRFKLEAKSSEEVARALRLLELMQEAKIFSLSNARALKQPGRTIVRLYVMSPGKSFESNFTDVEVEENLQALLLLKLFEEYATSKEKLREETLAAGTASTGSPG